MNPIIRELLIEEPIKLSPEGQQVVISAYDIAVKNGFVGTESEWLQTLQFIQSPITAEVLAAAQAAAASALAAGSSEQVALEKAAEMIQLAQAVLALRNQAESLASASGSFATDSGISATASEAAKALSESAKVIATQQATISTDKAVESAASAFASEAAKNLSVSAKDTAIVKAGEANQSAITTTTQAGIATAKAVESAASSLQSGQDAASALASKNQSVASASDSNASAVASEVARLASVAAQGIAIEEAGKSLTKAGESAASAAAAAASSALITNKAEVNITSEGNILRADGTLFKSISEVEFFRNINSYRKAPDSKFFDNKQLIAWDNFDRPNESPVIQSDSGHTYSIFKTNIIGSLVSKSFGGGDSSILTETSAQITITPTKNIGLEFSFSRSTLGGTSTGIAIVKDNLNYFYFGRIANSSNTLFPELGNSVNYRLIVVINGVATVLGEIGQDSLYEFSINDGFFRSRINFVIKYGNRGRNDASVILVQSLDKPSLRIQVAVTNYNSTFVTPADYNRIAVISNTQTVIYAYKVANLNL
jgi:hypothetical protein